MDWNHSHVWIRKVMMDMQLHQMSWPQFLMSRSDDSVCVLWIKLYFSVLSVESLGRSGVLFTLSQCSRCSPSDIISLHPLLKENSWISVLSPYFLSRFFFFSRFKGLCVFEKSWHIHCHGLLVSSQSEHQGAIWQGFVYVIVMFPCAFPSLLQ